MRAPGLGRVVFVACLGLSAATTARADKLYLDGGGSIRTNHWWYDGDNVMYESPVGTVGIPRSIVVRIEKSDGSSSQSLAEPREVSRRRPEAPAEPPEKEGKIHVSREVGELLLRAREALEAGDYQASSDLYEQALSKAEPDLHVPRVGYALSEMALGRDRTAMAVVLDGLARTPNEASLLEVLGDLHNRRELVQDALRAWEQAFAASPGDRLRGKIEKARRELEAARNYSFSTTAHFNLRYDGQVDATLGRAVADFLEREYWVIADRLRHAPPQPITVLLYPQQEFREVTQTPEWVGGIYDGKIRVPIAGLKRLDPRAEAVLRHELAHAVVHSKTRGNCPRWLHEGVAQIAENRPLRRADRIQILEDLEGVEPGDWESAGLSYPMALSLTRYLESLRGFDGLVQVLDVLGEGSDAETAVEAVYRVPYDRLCREWVRDLRRGVER